MPAPSSATLFGLNEEELNNQQNQQHQHSPGEGASPVIASSPPGDSSQRRKRNQPGNPSPNDEVIALSPKTLMATNRFLCEVCNKGFQREQNLQLHRRGHNLPWKLKQKTNQEARKKVYICPEIGCVHHDPSRALGDLTGIKKHFFRKHGEKKFRCEKCNKKYAVHSDWKAHNKICGTKEYKCECGTTFSRRDSFISHRSFCDALVVDVASHTISRSPYSSLAASLNGNASNAGSGSAGSLIPGNHQQLSSPMFGFGASRLNSFTTLLSGQSVGSAFQPLQTQHVPLNPPQPKLGFSDFPGHCGFPNNTALVNMFNLGFTGNADMNSSQNELDLNINNSFSGLMMNVDQAPHVYNNLNSTFPSHSLSATALLQKAMLSGANSNNTAIMKSMENSVSGGMKFNDYGGAFGDGMSGGGQGGSSTFQEMYNNLNVGGGSCGNGGYGGGMEYLSDMNAPYGGMMLDGGINNNVMVESQMNVQNEYCDKLTRDFLGMGKEMKNFSDGGMEDDHNGNGMKTSSPDSVVTTSAEPMPFVPDPHRGF